MRPRRLLVVAAWASLVAVGFLGNPSAEGDCRPPNGTWPLYGNPYASTQLGHCIYLANYWLNEPACPADVRLQWQGVRNRALMGMWKPYSPTTSPLTCAQAHAYATEALQHAMLANNAADPRPPLTACLDALDHID
jgi:hypothetical protein